MFHRSHRVLLFFSEAGMRFSLFSISRLKLFTKLADESRVNLGDYIGPGSGARFHDNGSKWPLVPEPKSEGPNNRKQAGPFTGSSK